jgi:CRP-like cAMP-binding protein
MLSWLYEQMNAIHPLDESVFKEFDNSFEYLEYSKNSILLREGETCHYLYVMLDGLARIYYLKEDREINALFVEEKSFFTAPDSFFSRKPSYHFIETLLPSKLARIHHEKLRRLYEEFPELNFVGRIITENYFVWSEEKLFLLRKHNAEERYHYFMENYPELLQKVPLKYLASYLGMNEETLSRIRNKIRKSVV